MDFSGFKRTKTDLWVWIMCPPLLVLLIVLSSSVYGRGVRNELDWTSRVIETVPDILETLEKAKTLVARFDDRTEGQGDPAESLRSLVNAAAAGSGFVLDSMSVTKEKKKKAGTRDALRAALVGRGSLFSITKCFNELQAPDTLVAVEKADIRAERFDPMPIYKAEFVLRYSDVTL